MSRVEQLISRDTADNEGGCVPAREPAAGTPPPAACEAADAVLTPGMHVADLVVVSNDRERLVLRGRKGAAAAVIGVGVGVIIFGVSAWWWHVNGQSLHSYKLLFVPVCGVLLVLGGMAKRGTVFAFDGPSGTLHTDGWDGPAIKRAGELREVCLTVVPSATWRGDSLLLTLPHLDPKLKRWTSVVVARRDTGRPDAAHLVVAARQIAVLLGLPITWHGVFRHGHANLRRAILAARGPSVPCAGSQACFDSTTKSRW